MVLHLHLSPAVFDYTDWTWLGKPHTCLYKTLQLTVHVRANENHEVKGTARRAQRQNCGKAQIWPRLQKNSAALKVPKSTVASIIKNFLALILSGMCGENQALLITCPIQSQQWSMVVAASCCGGVFQLQGQDDWLQSRERWMRPSTGISWTKTFSRVLRTSDWAEGLPSNKTMTLSTQLK